MKNKLFTGERTYNTTNSADQTDQSIWKNKIVWEDERNYPQGSDIYMKSFYINSKSDVHKT